METEQPKVPPSTAVTTETPATPDIRKAFEELRGKFNQALDDVTKAAPVGARTLAAVRCGGGCHQGVID